MEKIKQIIESIEVGRMDLDKEPSTHKEEYVDDPASEYIVHKVEGHENFEVFFEEREEFKDARQKIYDGADESIFDELVNNEYSDQFNYDYVAAYRLDGGDIEWIESTEKRKHLNKDSEHSFFD